MARQICMPKLNEIESDIIVADWLVRVGDTIKEGALIVSVETDKVTVEVEASMEGTVRRLLVSKGDTVKVGQPILEVE